MVSSPLAMWSCTWCLALLVCRALRPDAAGALCGGCYHLRRSAPANLQGPCGPKQLRSLLHQQLHLVTTCLGMFSFGLLLQLQWPSHLPRRPALALLWLHAERWLAALWRCGAAPGAWRFLFAELYDQMLLELFVVAATICGVLHPQTCKGRVDQNSCVRCCISNYTL